MEASLGATTMGSLKVFSHASVEGVEGIEVSRKELYMFRLTDPYVYVDLALLKIKIDTYIDGEKKNKDKKADPGVNATDFAN